MNDSRQILDQYFAERARGIVHTPEWDDLMRQHMEALAHEQQLKADLLEAEHRTNSLPTKVSPWLKRHEETTALEEIETKNLWASGL